MSSHGQKSPCLHIPLVGLCLWVPFCLLQPKSCVHTGPRPRQSSLAQLLGLQTLVLCSRLRGGSAGSSGFLALACLFSPQHSLGRPGSELVEGIGSGCTEGSFQVSSISGALGHDLRAPGLAPHVAAYSQRPGLCCEGCCSTLGTETEGAVMQNSSPCHHLLNVPSRVQSGRLAPLPAPGQAHGWGIG